MQHEPPEPSGESPPESPPESSFGSDFLTFGVLTELGIGGMTFILAWLFGGSVLGHWEENWSEAAVLRRQISTGLLATLPMLGLFVILDRLPLRSLKAIQETLDAHLMPRLAQAQLPGILALALAAGFGEELLFRGWLQPRITDLVGYPHGVTTGIIVASLAFGICHWMNWTYALLATLIGVYLGVVAQWTNGILAAAVAHSTYDFVVLWVLLRRRRKMDVDRCRAKSADVR
jgi:membrane protease YdiL (CAAX protease family)